MPSLEQLYRQVILSHTRVRHGPDTVEGVDASSHQVNPTCGDRVTLGAQLAPGGAIKRIVWDGGGCFISWASLPMFAELVDKRPSINEVVKAYGVMEQMMHSRNCGVSEEVLDLLGDATALESTFQSANHVKCALLGWYTPHDVLAKLGTDIAGDRA